MYRTPLSSRRQNGHLPAAQSNVSGLILPQAPFLGGLQQQHLQRNGVSLYSPRSKASAHSALQGQPAAPALSPRQAPAPALSPRQARRTASKDHSSITPPSNLTALSTHAAPAANRPVVPPLRLHQASQQQQQSQLYSPRRYVKPAPLDGLIPRAALHYHHSEHSRHAHAQPGTASLTWRGPLSSPRTQHAAARSQHVSHQRSLQGSPSLVALSRSALCKWLLWRRSLGIALTASQLVCSCCHESPVHWQLLRANCAQQ